MATVSNPQAELEKVVGWRELTLTQAGFEAKRAARLAVDTSMDVHALVGLVKRGATPDEAERIVR